MLNGNSLRAILARTLKLLLKILIVFAFPAADRFAPSHGLVCFRRFQRPELRKHPGVSLIACRQPSLERNEQFSSLPSLRLGY